jgi:hypothetical protein
VQLATAARCGLPVPETLITNDPDAVRRFASCGATVTKMLGANHIAEEGTRKVTFTRLLDDDDLADLRGIEVTTHQFQRWAPKQYDARVIAIGLAEHGPYNRIVATCSVPAGLWRWIQQTREDGRILVDFKIGQQAGNLVLLQRRGNTAEGRFDPTFGSFMGIRRRGETYRCGGRAVGTQTRECAKQRATTVDLTRPWELSSFWFFAHTALPQGTIFSLRGEGPDEPPRNTVLAAPDGSRCEVREDLEVNGTRTVWKAGPCALWRIVEDAHDRWCQLGQPGWGRFGLTVTVERQSIWLDAPDSEHIWTRPSGMRTSTADDGLGFDLDLPAGVKQSGDDHHGGRRANLSE